MHIAVIDGDVLLYLSCRNRYPQEAGKTIVTLDDDGERVPIEFSKAEDAAYLEESWNNVKDNIKDTLEQLYCTDYVMAVKGEGNFRDEIYPEYKANRRNKTHDNTYRIVKTLRSLAIHEGLAVPAHGMEADDLVRIWANEAKSAGRIPIVCSNDKDLKCIPGKYWNLKTKKLEDISEEEATRLYYEQLLKGDPTDNIPGLPGVGPIGAKKALASCVTEEEFQEVVISSYILAYDKEWCDYLLSNGKMIHIKRHIGDYFTLEDWPLAQELR